MCYSPVPWYKMYSFLWKIVEYKVHGGIVGFIYTI
jgi:hypothetical protein